MKIIAIIQARMGSMRFPGKVMKPILGRPLIDLLVARLSRSKLVEEIVLATGTGPGEEPLVTFARNLGISVYQGSEFDVLERYYEAADKHKADIVVRITGDRPLVDPALVDSVVQILLKNDLDYASNVAPPTFPDGLDVEVMTMRALAEAHQKAREPSEREHVTPYIRKVFGVPEGNLAADDDLSERRWTVDLPEDLQVVEAVFTHFDPRLDFSFEEVRKLQDVNPEMFKANRGVIRNEGAETSAGQKLWARARRVIPGGNMLLSKRPEMFLPEQWPAYFSRAKGTRVWDLEGRSYLDFSLMGVGTNTLGYGNEAVDKAVMETVRAGNMSTLNCPEEVYLAERLVELHPWSDMVRLARTGGEANAIAIRIARAAAGRDAVAICGYHGWHDWYIATNLAHDGNLDAHLLPGLSPTGVPRNLRGSVLPFRYNRLDELEAIIREHKIGVIKMEVLRNEEPRDDFLKRIREIADREGIVLIFDECTSGFRQTYGGLHKQYGVNPDMAVFGKTLGNGYAITAVIGKRSVMEAAQSTFISSTFWTERIGPVAGLTTLDEMQRIKSWELITAVGNKIKRGWQELADEYGLNIKITGLPALAGFAFESKNALAYKTLITQDMLAAGFLAGTALYACVGHDDEQIDLYFECLRPIFARIRECEDGRDPAEFLRGPLCHSGFQRLN